MAELFPLNGVPEMDVTPPGGMGKFEGVKESETLIEAKDIFAGEIALPAVDFGTDGVTGNGIATLNYRLKLSIDQKKINVTGRVVKEMRIQADAAGARAITLEVDELNAGTYSLVLQTSAGSTSTKVIVSK